MNAEQNRKIIIKIWQWWWVVCSNHFDILLCHCRCTSYPIVPQASMRSVISDRKQEYIVRYCPGDDHISLPHRCWCIACVVLPSEWRERKTWCFLFCAFTGTSVSLLFFLLLAINLLLLHFNLSVVVVQKRQRILLNLLKLTLWFCKKDGQWFPYQRYSTHWYIYRLEAEGRM